MPSGEGIHSINERWASILEAIIFPHSLAKSVNDRIIALRDGLSTG